MSSPRRHQSLYSNFARKSFLSLKQEVLGPLDRETAGGSRDRIGYYWFSTTIPKYPILLVAHPSWIGKNMMLLWDGPITLVLQERECLEMFVRYVILLSLMGIDCSPLLSSAELLLVGALSLRPPQGKGLFFILLVLPATYGQALWSPLLIGGDTRVLCMQVPRVKAWLVKAWLVKPWLVFSRLSSPFN